MSRRFFLFCILFALFYCVDLWCMTNLLKSFSL
nr:MAG TPA: hypothetical protein [Caudoviricetes sp.]